MDTIEKVFAHNLRKERGERTQAKMAELAGVPYRTYQNLEQGVVLPQRQTLEAIAHVFGVPPTALFMDPDLTGTPTPEECLEILRQHLATAPPRESLSPLKRELIAKITSATQEDEALLSSMSRDFDAYLDAVNKPTESRQNAKKRS